MPLYKPYLGIFKTMSMLKKLRFNFMNSKQLVNTDDGSAELNLSDTKQESIHDWWYHQKQVKAWRKLGLCV